MESSGIVISSSTASLHLKPLLSNLSEASLAESVGAERRVQPERRRSWAPKESSIWEHRGIIGHHGFELVPFQEQNLLFS